MVFRKLSPQTYSFTSLHERVCDTPHEEQDSTTQYLGKKLLTTERELRAYKAQVDEQPNVQQSEKIHEDENLCRHIRKIILHRLLRIRDERHQLYLDNLSLPVSERAQAARCPVYHLAA